MMKKTWFALAVTAALGGTAMAGHKQSQSVVIIDNQAWGSLGDARSSDNFVEFIGCQITAGGGSSAHAFCWARDVNNVSLTCQTSDPHVVTVAASLGPTAGISFIAEKNGSCRFIAAMNYSYTAPAVP